MANWKGLLIGSGRTGKQKLERDLRWEPDFKYLAGTRERSGQWVMGPD